MGVDVLDVAGVCCAGVGVGRIREAFTDLVGKSPLYHKVPRVAPMPINGTRIKSAVMKSTLRAERFGLEERGFARFHTSISCRDEDIGGCDGASTSRCSDSVGEDLLAGLFEVTIGEDEANIAYRRVVSHVLCCSRKVQSHL